MLFIEGIVMARTTHYVDGLLSFLEDYNPSKYLVTPKKFVSNRLKSENSMTDVLLQFKKGLLYLILSLWLCANTISFIKSSWRSPVAA